MLLAKIKSLVEKVKCKNLTDEFFAELKERKIINLRVTLYTLAKYLVDDQLQRTGILYSPNDAYIQTKVQSLFWEWKNEGLINEMDDFEPTTKNWIIQYS